MSDEAKLLSCPFCGGKTQIIRFHESWRVECTKCNAQMGYRNPAYSAVKGQLHFEKKEDCIKTWNRRAENLAGIGDDTVGDLQKHTSDILE